MKLNYIETIKVIISQNDIDDCSQQIKKNKQVQNYIKLNELGYVTKNEKHDFTEHLLPILFSIYIYIYIYII